MFVQKDFSICIAEKKIFDYKLMSIRKLFTILLIRNKKLTASGDMFIVNIIMNMVRPRASFARHSPASQ